MPEILLGAGGGFLVIPALLFFAKLPLKHAVGTLMLIISINFLICFGGDALSKKIDGAALKPIFGWFVRVMGIYIIIKERHCCKSGIP